MDQHIQSILDEYRRDLPLFQEAASTIASQIRSTLAEAGIVVAAVESRVKSYDSLAGKLELKAKSTLPSPTSRMFSAFASSPSTSTTWTR